VSAHRIMRLAIALAVASVLPNRVGLGAQELQLAENSSRGPRFLYADVPGKSKTVPVDIARTPVLTRKIALNLEGVTVREALTAITQQSGINLIYGRDVVPEEARVRLRAEEITVAAALTDVLLNAGIDVVFTKSGSAALVKRSAPPAVGTITGRVTEAQTDTPIPQVQVSVEGTNRGSATAFDGRYTITNVPAGLHSVTARRLGYQQVSKEVTVVDGQMANVDFALQTATTRLSEIVTTATGEQRRAELGNTIGNIRATKVVPESPVMSFTDVLNARVSSVQIITTGGLTGTSPHIRIRGVNSLTSIYNNPGTPSNEPLIIIDGNRVDNSPSVTTPAYTSQSVITLGVRSGRLNDINPEDIENIEVVKGPSAATLYGTDAANGVIVITTKRGLPGNAEWTVMGEGGLITQPAHFPENYYAWGHNLTTGAAQQCILTQRAAGLCAIDSLSFYNPLNDPVASQFSTGNRSQLGLQVRGGLNQVTYFLSGEREDEIGVDKMPQLEVTRLLAERGVSTLPSDQIRPNAMSKTSGRANFAIPLGAKATFSVNTALISNYVRNPGDLGIDLSTEGPGSKNINRGYASFSGFPGDYFALRSSESTVRFLSSGNWDYAPRSWLALKGTVGSDVSSAGVEALQRRDEGPLYFGRTGQRYNGRIQTSLTTVNAGATARSTLSERWAARTSTGVQYNRRVELTSYVSAIGLAPGSETAAGAGSLSGGEKTLETIVAGAYGEQEFILNDHLFLTGALRFDGGSAFGQNFRTVAYPKAGVSWIALENPQGRLSSVRVRGAYGASGVQPYPTAAIPQISLKTTLVGGVTAPGGTLSATGNPDLKPERQREIEGGIDAAFLGDRVHIEGTYYRRQSSDALFNLPLPPSVGVGSRQVNLGSIRNEGLETTVSARVLDGRAVAWDVGLNAGWNRNRIVDMPKVLENVTVTNQPSSGLKNGYPLYSLYARPILGYADANGNGIIEANEITVGDSAVYAGTRLPTRQLTANTTVSLLDGHLRASTLVDYRGGYHMNYGYFRCRLDFNCRGVNDPSAPFDLQAAAVAANASAYNNTYWGFFADASFVRWRELSIAYDLPTGIIGRTTAKRATIVLSGRNLGIHTKYPGNDPEVASGGGELQAYDDDVRSVPPVRYWIVRLNLGF
jgi:TonB-linked SusC/RagA family outer membrane protein